ncbi:hypothetical protein LI90_2819 [Carbonactinospora thermoautotrophica]|uniref:Uncharacterized protein n=1 Tax=Carbonactinospora thermoautotrophica TaxID=1469144 RepID=A0A132MVE4_9ACTN|nr:hypothetical protein LI90_2819 [Carbonactinospora thermoautotrophica]
MCAQADLLDEFWPGRRTHLFDQACLRGRTPVCGRPAS